MKQKLLLKTMLLLCILVGGASNAWGTEEVYKTALFGSSYNSKGVSSYDATWTSTNSGFTVSLSNFNNNNNAWNYVKCGRKNNASVGTITTSAAIDEAITKVVVTIDAITGANVNSIKLYTSSDNSTWTEAGSFNKSTGKKEVSLSSPTANLYYKVEFDCASASSNGVVTVSKVEYYHNAGPVTYTVTYDGNGNTSGTAPTDASSPYTSGSTVTVLGNTDNLVKAGCTFGGWNTQADGLGTDRAVGSTFNISANTTLYAKWNAKTITGLSYTGTPTKTTYVGGEIFDPTGLTVTATFDDSSNEDVTTSVTWTPSPLTAGTTSVTGTYMGQTINVTGLTVTAAPGTSANPYTIVQAKAAIDAGTGVTDVYVRGIVCTGGSNYYSSSKLNYWISDDGTTGNRLEIYRGLGLDGADFSGTSDIQVGDIVTVRGNITLYNSTTYEFSEGSQITSFKRKTASDLTITSSTPVALETTTAVLNPTSTITWTTSSKGAMSFESNATGVATVSSDGVITAVGAGSATITITQATDEDYKASDEKTVTVNVTDNRFACATGIDLSSAKTILKGGSGALAATSTAADGFTGSITYSYVSDDTDIFSITDGNYTGAGVGATTVTITATPTGGNAANYKPASQEVAVTVNGTNSISLDPTSKTVAFSASTFNIAATVPTENYNGTVTAESNNTSVATVSVDGTTVTVTPVAVGTATITVTAGTGTYYLATAQAECAVEFTAPAGSTKAPSSEVTYTFDFSDNTNWSFPTDYTTGENTYTKAGKTITLNTPDDNNGYKFNSSVILFGKEGATLSLPTFDKPVTKISTTGVSGASGKVTQNIYVGSTAVSTETTSAKEDHEYEIDSEYQAAGTIYTFKVTNGNNTQLSDLTVHMYQAPTATVTLNKYGYATYCSVNPIDFSSTTGYTAWRISSIAADGTITFAKVTEKIKGGQGVLLYNKDADGVNTSNVTINFADGTTEFDDEENKFVGTTAITNITADTYLGLKGNTFVPVNAGNIPAGKALLPASAIPASARELQFVFEDETTAIRGIENSELRMENSFFDLQGRKIAKPTKGLYIKNGKKVVLK